jgi:hypothetical protein
MNQRAQAGEGQDREPAEWRALSDTRWCAGSSRARVPLYEILMRRYNQRLFRVACSILRDPAEAEDVMQHAYVEAYRHLDQFAGRCPVLDLADQDRGVRGPVPGPPAGHDSGRLRSPPPPSRTP